MVQPAGDEQALRPIIQVMRTEGFFLYRRLQPLDLRLIFTRVITTFTPDDDVASACANLATALSNSTDQGHHWGHGEADHCP